MGRSINTLSSHPSSLFSSISISASCMYTTSRGEISVYFLSWESKQVHATFKDGDSTVKQ